MPEEQKEKQQSHGDDAVSEKLMQQIGSLIEKQGGSAEAMKVLMDDNLNLRGKNRQLRDQLAEAKKLVPADGAVVLNPNTDEAKAWKEITDLKIKPGDVVQRLQAGTEAEAKVARNEREKQDTEAAQLAGYKPSVLTRELELRGARTEIKEAETTVNGKTLRARVPHVVTGEGKDAKSEPLTDYAERELVDYLSSLRADAAPSTTAARTPMPRMQGESRAADASDYEAVKAKKRATGAYAI